MRRSVGFGLLLGLGVLTLVGCSVFRNPEAPKCDPHMGYQTIPTAQPLRVPPGLKAPEQSSATPMPSGPRAAVFSAPDGRCLESPPSYFARAGQTDEPGLPVAQTIGLEGADGAKGSGPVLISGASVLTNDIAAFLDDWAKVWTSRNADGYFQFYSTDFVPAGYQDHGQWRDTQRERFSIQAQTEIVLDSLRVDTQADGSVTAEFVQRFGVAPDYRSVLKQMSIEKGGPKGWLIKSERILDVL